MHPLCQLYAAECSLGHLHVSTQQGIREAWGSAIYSTA